MRIGERVLLLADEKGVKRAALAKALGIGRSTVTGWEQSNRNPSSELIVPICELLDVSERYLLTGEEKNTDFNNAEESLLVERYRLLDADGRDIVRVAVLNEWRRMNQEQPLGVAINPAPPQPSPGREEKLANAREVAADVNRRIERAKNMAQAPPGNLSGKSKKAQD